MMKIISIENISKTYGEKQLFHDVSFTISDGERVGLIGVNGTGKSSLLRIVAGADGADSGEIVKPKDYRISYLVQTPVLNEQLSVIEQIFQGEAPVITLVREYEKTLKRLSEQPLNEGIQNRLFELQRQMDTMNGWELDTSAKMILGKLGIEDIHKKISELSGGQRKRVALAQVLIQDADLLILDEPTNHLDYQSIKWLEDFLNRYSGAVFLVTHDRYFLDRVTNRMFELSEGKLYSYKGNYAAFLEAKAVREENEAAAADKRKNLYRRELEWIRRGARARSTKQKARIQRFMELEQQTASVKSAEKLDISLSGSRLGKQVFELKNADKAFGGQTILKDFNLLVKPGERLGIVGRNGTGKSTLLNILAGKTALDSGELLTGQTVKIAYYTQEHEDMDENQRMIEYINETAHVVTASDGKTITAAQMLERFLFPRYSHGVLVRKLSGGEKRRLYLLKLLMSEPNVLLLDEPTNDLDTETLTVLEDYLDDFPGVVITVSHDRYFLDKVADRLLIFNGKGIVDSFYGSYTEYLEQSLLEESDATGAEKAEKERHPRAEQRKKKMSYKEKREWETIDDDIAAVEERLKSLAEEMAAAGSDFEKIRTLMDEETALNEKLEFLIERWSYLAELAEGE